MSIQYGPILRWPGKLTATRRKAPFKAGGAETLRLLDRELRMISAESAVVQLALAPDQFTRDGRPYVNARAQHPGVIVAFRKPVRNALGQSIKVPLSFPADTFTTWESNLRAVAIALEDLRRIDRYGVTQNSEQYQGFKALPPPGPTDNAIATVEDAARFLERVAGAAPGQVLRLSAVYADAYRAAAKKCHPDAGGQPADWSKLQAAASMLDDLHKGAR